MVGRVARSCHRYRRQFLSVLSLIFASALVCHCMFDGVYSTAFALAMLNPRRPDF
jgi:hypothetical protein